MADEMQDEMQELIRDFVIETDEVLEGLDQCFVKLEESPGDLGLINEIFRAVHSIKGSAGFLGFTRLVEGAHESEKPGETSLRHPELVSVSQMNPNQEILKQVQNDGNENLTKSQEKKSDK